jgi:serine/threonine-protein kinase HipA
MSKLLDVYFHEKIIGELKQDDHGDINFTYSASWLADPNAIKISCSLPLQQETFKRKNCKAFFEGILPEEMQRKLIAKNLSISANNDFSMLEKIGGECAGALSFIPSREKLHPNNNNYYELIGAQLPNILQELPSRPLLAGERGVRLSLAGVQDKLAVYVEDEKIFIPLNNSPSTHILKPDFSIFDGVIFNEDICLKLAKKIGLSVVEGNLKTVDNINYLLIKRYDRIFANEDKNPKEIKRVHQEDFCQALGISSKNKYQKEGGPSLKQCFNLIRHESSIPVIDLVKMINAIIFNFLIGNCDAHGKNFSLLYLDQLQVAPLYDLVCTLYYQDLDQRMAMKLGGEYRIHNIHAENFDLLADEIGFAKPEVRRRILELIDSILSSLPTLETHNQVQEEIINLIRTRCENLALHFQRRIRHS